METEPKPIKTVLGVGSFVVRHLVATAICVVTPCVLFTILYFALLVWAMIANEDPGGPLLYPIGVLAILMASAISSTLLLFPSVSVAEILARRFGWPLPTQIPVSVFLLGAFSLVGFGIFAGIFSSFSPAEVLPATLTVFAVLLVPLGLYWWAAQGPPIIFSILRKVFGWIRRTRRDRSLPLPTATHPQ